MGWSETQRKWKQNARATAERRKRWQRIQEEQMEEEEEKMKKALEKRKRDMANKNRYLRQPRAKPPPPRNKFLTKGSRADKQKNSNAAKATEFRLLQDRRADEQASSSSSAAKRNHDLKDFIREQRATMRAVHQDGGIDIFEMGNVGAAGPCVGEAKGWSDLKAEAGANLENILSTYSNDSLTPEDRGEACQELLDNCKEVNELQRHLSHPGKEEACEPQAPYATTTTTTCATTNVCPSLMCEDESVPLLRRGCVSTARHRASPRCVFSMDSLDGSPVQIPLAGEDLGFRRDVNVNTAKVTDEDADAKVPVTPTTPSEKSKKASAWSLSGDSFELKNEEDMDRVWRNAHSGSAKAGGESTLDKMSTKVVSILDVKALDKLASEKTIERYPSQVAEQQVGGLSWFCRVDATDGADACSNFNLNQNRHKNKLPRKDLRNDSLYRHRFGNKMNAEQTGATKRIAGDDLKLDKLMLDDPKPMAASPASAGKEIANLTHAKHHRTGCAKSVSRSKDASPAVLKKMPATGSDTQRPKEGIEGPLVHKGSYAIAKQASKERKASSATKRKVPLREHNQVRPSAKSEASVPFPSPLPSSPEVIRGNRMQRGDMAEVATVDGRVRDARGKPTTISMEEARLMESIAKLSDLHPLQGKQQGSGESANAAVVNRSIAEKSLLASIHKLDVRLLMLNQNAKVGPGLRQQQQKQPLVLSDDDDDEVGGDGCGTLSPRETVSVQDDHLRRKIATQNAAQSSKVSSNACDRRKLNNVGLTNHNHFAKPPPVPKKQVEQVDREQYHRSPNADTSAQATASLGGAAPVRRHVGESGGKIVLSSAARFLL